MCSGLKAVRIELVEGKALRQEYDHWVDKDQACNKIFPLCRCTTDAATKEPGTFLQGLRRELEVDLAEIAFKLSKIEGINE